jgi:hypothetical protein
MSNIRKRFAALILALSALFGGLALAGVADAGTYWTTQNCNHATAGSRICFDKSAGTVTVYNNANAIVAGPTPATSTFNPTRGYIAYDFECNSVPISTITYTENWAVGAPPVPGNPPTVDTVWVTQFNTPGGYGLPGTVKIGNQPWITGTNVDVNSSADDVIAWYANSNQGYECIVVP